MGQREISIEFLNYFCRGDIESLNTLLTEDFQLKGPFYQFNSRHAYLSHLAQDPPQESDFKILKIFEEGNEVGLFYEFSKPQCSTVIAQLYKFRGHQIAEILLIFDSRAFT